jgi:hypothetical protein
MAGHAGMQIFRADLARLKASIQVIAVRLDLSWKPCLA